jgi:sugar phosphate isomerase/epimerase
MNFESPIQSTESVEKESLGIDFFVTDHNLLYEDRTNPDHQREVYAEMKKHGVDSIRFDLWWKELAPVQNEDHRDEIIDRYADAMKMMQEEGLKPPTLVVSNPPEWIQKLYNSGQKDEYFSEYVKYLDDIAKIIQRSGVKAENLQVFNEINHSVLFKYVETDDLPKIVEMIRDTIGEVQPDVKVSTSLIIANFNEKLADIKDDTIDTSGSINGFLDQYGAMLKETFDVISLDYYPGVWHLPLAETLDKGTLSHSEMFKNVGALKEVCERMSKMGINYEIGEVGFPTNTPYNNERKQRYFYDSFFKAFREMIVDFKSRGVQLPKRVGLYETEDEANISFGGMMEKLLKIPLISKLSKLTPNPEHDFGLRKADGEPKMILKGNLHKDTEDAEEAETEESQLSKIIRYVNRPID